MSYSVWKDIYNDCWIILKTHYDLACIIWGKVISIFWLLINFLLDFCCFVWYIIFSYLKKSDDLPSLIQGTGLALLTILIPLALAILTEVYSKIKNESIEYKELDLHVILDNVFKIKNIVIYVFMIFIPLYAWEYSSVFARFIEISISLIGIFLIVIIIFNVYYWIKGNVYEYRFKYLKKVTYNSDLLVVWQSVWQVEKIIDQYENEFLKILSSVVDDSFQKDNAKGLMLIKEFRKNIHKRSLFSLVGNWVDNSNFFNKILEWHVFVWEKEIIGRNEPTESYYFYQILNNLNSIIERIEEKVLKANYGSYGYYFINKIKIHLNKHMDLTIEANNKKHHYCDELLTLFFPIFFDNIAQSPDVYDIWDSYFPEEWKITKDNLENPIANIPWKEFFNWSVKRPLSNTADYDKELDNVSLNLFPEIEPILWSDILHFIFFNFGFNTYKAVIENNKTFGNIGRVHSFAGGEDSDMWERSHKEIEKEKISTFDLAYYLFPSHFSKKNVEKHLNEFKKLENVYKKDSEEERNRIKYIELFEEMLEYKK